MNTTPKAHNKTGEEITSGTTPNLIVKTATSKQEAIPEIGKKETTLNYLILLNSKGEKVIINVGEKTYNAVEKLLK